MGIGSIPRARRLGWNGDGIPARDKLDGRIVALKVTRRREPVAVERFMREATILASLRHPGIVQYVDHGVTPDGDHYLAMEWLDGEVPRLPAGSAWTDGNGNTGSRPEGRRVPSLAHGRGLVHRDLKPSNLFLVAGEVERVKLVDFPGIARLGHETQRITRTGVMLGTPGYMAPEQIEGQPAHDPRADVFSLGCVLFECLTGRPAFEGVNAMAVLAKILLQEAPRVRALCPNVDEPLDALVARMLAKDPESRPRDAQQLAVELAVLGDRVRVSADPGEPEPRATPTRRAPHQTVSRPYRQALTLSEPRLVSVVLAGDPRLDSRRHRGALAEIPEVEAAIGRFGGQCHALAGGSLVGRCGAGVPLWTAPNELPSARSRYALAFPYCLSPSSRGVDLCRLVS